MKFYLAHSTIDKDFVKKHIEPKLKKRFKIINPFDYEQWGEDNKRFIEENATKELELLAEDTILRDLSNIKNSDGLIAFIKSPSIGVPMEIMYADKIYLPVYVIAPVKLHRTHPWLLFYCDKIFRDVDELLEELK